MLFYEESIFYILLMFHFIPIGACLVLLFDCPNLLPTFGPDSRPLLPAFIISQFLVTDTCCKGQGKSAEVYICAAIRMWLKLDKYANKRALGLQIVRMPKFYECSGV